MSLLKATSAAAGASTGAAPLIFRDNHEARWYLWVDSYELDPQGYRVLTTTDLGAGAWVPLQGIELPAATKHGTVLPLTRAEYDALDGAQFG